MAKLILSLDHALLNEYPLDQERLTIGRRPTNDVQIDNLAVVEQDAVWRLLIDAGIAWFAASTPPW